MSETAGARDGLLLVVCTANVCRSPLSMRLLAEALRGSPRLGRARVESAGTRTEPGWPMCEVSAGELPDDDAEREFARGHGSRPLTRELVQEADLVLAMEREQRSAIAQLAPGSQSKVFTLREVDGLLQVVAERGGAAPRDLRGLAAALHAVRGFAPLPPEPPKRRWFQRAPEPEDPLTIVDGHGLDEERHRAAAVAVRETTQRVAARIRALVD